MNRTFTRLLSLLICAILIGSSISALGQTGRISVEQALNAISKRHKTKFAYEHSVIQGKFTDAENLKTKNLDEVLKKVLYSNNLLFLYVSEGNYTIVSRDERLFQSVIPGNSTNAPTISADNDEHYLRGRVLDKNGDALPGATIKSNGSNRVVVSGSDGRFNMFVPDGATSVSVSYIGFQTSIIPIGRTSGNLTINMTPSALGQLKDVNVVSNGYQTLSKERITGAASTVTAEQIAKIPVPNVLQRLEGMVPGVRVNVLSSDRSFAYSSGTSTGSQISLNGGTRTVGRNDYNMSIRGISTLSGESFPLVVVDGAVSELDISTFNPDDIENISFLKDAAAASIWGARAANGVMVITTKRGKNTKQPSINASVSIGFSEKPDLGYYRTMNSAQQLEYERELVTRNFITDLGATNYNTGSYNRSEGTFLALRLKAGTITQAQYDARASQLSAIDNNSQISDFFLQRANNQQYNFSISGGSDSHTYYYSASYAKETPFVTRNGGQRLTATINNSWKLFKVATLSANLKGAFFNLANNGVSVASLYNSSGGATLMPYTLLADQNGNPVSVDRLNPAYTATLGSSYKDWRYSYLQEQLLNNDIQKDNSYVAGINLNIPILKGLSATGQYTNERTFSNRRVFYDPNSYQVRNMLNYLTPAGSTTNSAGLANNAGVLNTINTSINNYSLRGQLDFQRTLGKDHQVTALAGTEIRETNLGQGSQGLYGYNTQTGFSSNVSYLSNAYPTIAGFNSGLSLGGSPTQGDKRRRFLSYFSNAAYTFKDRYTVSGSVRYDDYNNFGVDRSLRATPLWSTGVKWNANREVFLKDLTWLSNLALRATYGVNGNISTTVYPFTNIGLYSSADAVNNQAAAFISAPANPGIRWEKTFVTNLGLDFGFLQNKITGSFDAYWKRGRDLLYAFPISSTYVGTISTTLTTNSASLNGRGIDLSLNASLLNAGGVNWSAGGNFSYSTNEAADNRFRDNLTTSFYSSPGSIPFVTGYPTDKIFVYKNAGLDASGLTQIFDENGGIIRANTATVPSFGALKFAGRASAPYFGSINQTLSYKGFNLFVLATYQFGNVFLKPSVSNYALANFNVTYDKSIDIASRWKSPGDEAGTSIPGLNGTPAVINTSLLRYQYSDINVLKGDYIRLREVSLSYDLPAQAILKQIKSAKVSLAVRNLGFIWKANKEGYDPDVVNYTNTPFNFPAARTYNLSLNMNF
ncbi:SusC/RagA family TonB-linked outer membrane protein [Pedobacter agri]|uniref:SusC/RagA family TonB-linked outer membrane protein n=1 Tax=Pedobacter agri TaxID=454586 RepID=UPI00292FF740|nr:SusC/RagA family TonB-linked outer membrane protein [Pedobacter agri]